MEKDADLLILIPKKLQISKIFPTFAVEISKVVKNRPMFYYHSEVFVEYGNLKAQGALYNEDLTSQSLHNSNHKMSSIPLSGIIS